MKPYKLNGTNLTSSGKETLQVPTLILQVHDHQERTIRAIDDDITTNETTIVK